LQIRCDETYPDITKFNDFGSEPKDTESLDDAKATRYAADCALREHFSNINHSNNTDAKNITFQRGGK